MICVCFLLLKNDICIMLRHKWMEDLVEDMIDHIGQIFEYAKI